MTQFYKWLLFISSYAPLYLLVALNNYKFEESFLWNFHDVAETSYKQWFWIVLITLFIISIVTVLILQSVSLNETRQIDNLVSINENILSYIITYVVPLTVINIDNINSLLVNLVLFIIIGIIYVNNDLIYLNILIIFIGFHVYKDSMDNKIITNLSKNELKEITVSNEPVKYRELAKGIFLVKKK